MVKTRSSAIGVCAEARKVTTEQGPRRKKRSTNCSSSQNKRAKTTTQLDNKVCEDIRKQILGQRIARTVLVEEKPSTTPRKDETYCFGKIVSVQRGTDLDDDLYRVSYDDGTSEDLNTLTLFGKYW